jgi:hypothetical protein
MAILNLLVPLILVITTILPFHVNIGDQYDEDKIFQCPNNP